MNRKKLLAAGAVGLLAFYTPAGAWTRTQLASLVSGPQVSALFVSWREVPGATGYEVAVDGRVIDRLNRNARGAQVPVGMASLVEIKDLPDRSVTQVVDFTQQLG